MLTSVGGLCRASTHKKGNNVTNDVPRAAGKYVELATQIGQLVEQKQAAYGDSFSKSQEILKVLYPDGIKAEDLQWALTITRIVDKLFRIATNDDVFQEDPWQDICGYALLAAQHCREMRADSNGVVTSSSDQGLQQIRQHMESAFDATPSQCFKGLEGLARYHAHSQDHPVKK